MILSLAPFILAALLGAAVAQAPPQSAAPAASWRLLPGEMADQRWAPAACLIRGGRQAILAGGYSYAKKACVDSITLFDSSEKRLSSSRSRLPYPADFVMASPLPNGDVLLAGGFNDVWGSLNTAALYHPRDDTCIRLDCPMRARRELAQATVLEDGSVLITGGLNLSARTTLADAEIYDPARRVFKSTAAPMRGDRFGHSACRLADGRVLVVGGTHWDLRKHDSKVLATAELYNPSDGTFHECTGSLVSARDRPTTTLLPDGQVLVAGGQGVGGEAVTTAELFDPSTERFTLVIGQPLEPRMAHSAVSLANDDVLICGGWNAVKKETTVSSVLYEWRSRKFVPGPELPFATHDLALLAFPNGLVLAAGGKSARGGASASNDRGAVMKLSTAR